MPQPGQADPVEGIEHLLTAPPAILHYQDQPVVTRHFEYDGLAWRVTYIAEHDGVGWRVINVHGARVAPGFKARQ